MCVFWRCRNSILQMCCIITSFPQNKNPDGNLFRVQLGHSTEHLCALCHLFTSSMSGMGSVKRRKSGLPGNWGTLWVGWRTRPWQRNQIWGGASSRFALSLSPGDRTKEQYNIKSISSGLCTLLCDYELVFFFFMLETELWGDKICQSVHHFGPDWNILTTIEWRLIPRGLILMTLLIT